jgi:hypothetical protein
MAGDLLSDALTGKEFNQWYELNEWFKCFVLPFSEKTLGFRVKPELKLFGGPLEKRACGAVGIKDGYIGVSLKYFRDVVNGRQRGGVTELRDTVVHEMAHLIARPKTEGDGHTREWREVYQKLRPLRRASYSLFAELSGQEPLAPRDL